MGLRIVFMGTPEFAVASLDKLIQSGHEIVSVVTVQDKPAGRGQNIQYSDVKQYALDKNLPILQPEKLKDAQFVEHLKNLQADIFAVVAFRKLPEEVWSIPRLGTINLHASLLPQYRGAAPINWVIINGETETGVTTFLIDKDIDTGKILLNRRVAVGPEDNAGDLHDRLMVIGADLLAKTIEGVANGCIKPISQSDLIKPEVEIKTAPKLDKENCRINWNDNSLRIVNFIRGLNPFPAAWSVIHNTKTFQDFSVKIFKSELVIYGQRTPGTILSDNSNFFNIATGDGIISVKELQLEGKKRLTAEEFLRGFRNIDEYKFVN